MDLKKTGMYIAAKRKKLGLTQKQLAEKLGMSDKSLSFRFSKYGRAATDILDFFADSVYYKLRSTNEQG